MLIIDDPLILVRLFFGEPWKTAIDFLTIFKVNFAIKFGEPFFLSTLHKNGEREPEDKKKNECENKITVKKKGACADKKPGGIDGITNHGVDALSNEGVFFNWASDFGFDRKKINE